MELRPTECALLTRLQRGIALEAAPFVGYGMAAEAVVQVLQRAQTGGLLRRFGGVFDAGCLGYKSMLCALAVDADRLEQVAAVICQEPGVTHCYERRPLVRTCWYPSLWFTITLRQAHFTAGLQALQARLPDDLTVLPLPALQRFKMEVVFDLGGAAPGPDVLVRTIPHQVAGVLRLTEDQQRLVRFVSGHLPLVERPFDLLAQELGLRVADLLGLLRDLKVQGGLRRIAPILYHRKAGFRANGMCVWPVTGDISAAGVHVAACSEVTHCYQRPRLANFPYDLYAMLHATSEVELRQRFEIIAGAAGLPDGNVMLSSREFKKSSMSYFA